MNTQRVEGHTPTPWKSYWRTDETHHADCGIFSETKPGQAYSVCRAPRYQTKEQWEADSAFILHAVNNIERLEKVNEALVEAIWNRIEAGHDDHCPATFMGHQKCSCGHDGLVAAWKLAKEPA